MVTCSKLCCLVLNLFLSKVIQTRPKDDHQFTNNSSPLPNIIELKHLDVTQSYDPKSVKHCNVPYRIALVGRDFYVLIYGRSHFQYCVQVASRDVIADKDTLDSTQRLSTKLVTEIVILSYIKRLECFNLFPVLYNLKIPQVFGV